MSNNSKIRPSFQLSVQKPEPNHKWNAEPNEPIKTQSKHSHVTDIHFVKCRKTCASESELCLV